jgi:hypothetical protein
MHVGICIASWWGFFKLKKIQEAACVARKDSKEQLDGQEQIQDYNEAHINKFRTVCTCLSCILFYAILCYVFKYVRNAFGMGDAYELFNALAGTFVFITFVCWRQSLNIIAEFRERKQKKSFANIGDVNIKLVESI